MNTTGRILSNGQVTIPTAARRQAGLSKGDLVNIACQRGKIVITPKIPTADNEYTPAQRRIIDARLAKADADIKAGRMSRAYSDPAELFAHLHKAAAKYGRSKTKRAGK